MNMRKKNVCAINWFGLSNAHENNLTSPLTMENLLVQQKWKSSNEKDISSLQIKQENDI